MTNNTNIDWPIVVKYFSLDSVGKPIFRSTLSHLATAFKMNPATLKKHLVKAYGGQLTFTRGRKGGMRLNRINSNQLLLPYPPTP